MIFPVFAIRDVTAGFQDLDVYPSKEFAERQFKYKVQNNWLITFKPADFDLYNIGQFDTDKGKMIPLELPVLICRGSDCVGEDFKDEVH